MNRGVLIVVLSQLLFCVLCKAQFVNVTSQFNLFVGGDYALSGSGMSFYDYDKDGWDDLTYAASNSPILVFRNVQGISFELAITFPNSFDAKQPVWVDYDNDGDADFFCTRYMGSCILYRNEGNNVFTDVTPDLNVPVSNAWSFGCSWADYDNDGFLDVYICNYQGIGSITNWLLHNNQDGTFTEVAESLGVDGGVATTFVCSWLDYDLDGDLDLFYANDHHQGNALFRNDNGEFFTEVTDNSGVNIPIDAMSSTVGDYDNDGDMDIYVTNNPAGGNLLLKNQNGQFFNVASEAGVSCNQLCWGALWLDGNNDLSSDLFVGVQTEIPARSDFYFANTGVDFQEDVSMGFSDDLDYTFCVAKGDFDNNGFYDIATTSYYTTNPSLWQNNNTGNHSLKIGLTGTISNRDGVGSFIDYFIEGLSYHHQAICGENYLGQNSQYLILSMGQATVMDSLFVRWPSGWVDVHYNLPADQFFAFVEGESFVNADNIYSVQFCPSSNVVLDAGNYETFAWNTGEVTQVIDVSESGEYSCSVSNIFGLPAVIDFIVSTFHEPTVNFTIQQPLCVGDSNAFIQITSPLFLENVHWNESPAEALITNLAAGVYPYSFDDNNSCFISGSVQIYDPEQLHVNVETTNACFNDEGSALLQIIGGTAPYATDWMSFNSQELPQGIYTVTVNDHNDCSASIDFVIEEFPQMTMTDVIQQACYSDVGTAQIFITGVDPPFIFDWNGADPNALIPGSYTVQITDGNGCSISHSLNIFGNSEMTYITQITPAQNGDDGSILIEVNGGSPPYFYNWSNGSTSENLGGLATGEYSCVITDQLGCSLFAEVSLLDLFSLDRFARCNVFPNPFSEYLIIESDLSSAYSLNDATGQCLISGSCTSKHHKISTQNLSEGVYFLKVGHRSFKVVK